MENFAISVCTHYPFHVQFSACVSRFRLSAISFINKVLGRFRDADRGFHTACIIREWRRSNETTTPISFRNDNFEGFPSRSQRTTLCFMLPRAVYHFITSTPRTFIPLIIYARAFSAERLTSCTCTEYAIITIASAAFNYPRWIAFPDFTV